MLLKAGHILIGKPYLGNQDYCLSALCDHLFYTLYIYLRLSASGHSVKQIDIVMPRVIVIAKLRDYGLLPVI